MEFKLKPVSINKCWQGRRFKTPLYKQFEKDLSTLIKSQKMPKYKGKVHVMIEVYFKNNLSDIDNILKPILDILVKNDIIEDDRFIVALTVCKHVLKGVEESFNITIFDWNKKDETI